MEKNTKHDPPDKEKKKKKDKKDKSEKASRDDEDSPRTKTKKEPFEKERGALSPKQEPSVARDSEGHKSHRKKSISAADGGLPSSSTAIPVPLAAASLPAASAPSLASSAPWQQAQPLPSGALAGGLANSNRRSLDYARPPLTSSTGGLAASDRTADKPKKTVAVADPLPVPSTPPESASPPSLGLLRDSKLLPKPDSSAAKLTPTKPSAVASGAVSLSEFPVVADSPVRSGVRERQALSVSAASPVVSRTPPSASTSIDPPTLLAGLRTRERAASMGALANGSSSDWTVEDRTIPTTRSSDDPDTFAVCLGSSPEPSLSDDQQGESSERDGSSRGSARPNKFEGDLERLRREEAQLKMQKEAMKRQIENVRKEKEDLFKKAKGDFRREAKQSRADFGIDTSATDSEMREHKIEKRRLKLAEEKLMREEHELRKKAREDFKQAEASIKKEKEKLLMEKEMALRKIKQDLKRVQQQRKRSSNSAAGSDVLMSGWMKMRGSPIRSWHMRWFVLRPGKLIYYTGEREKDCTGIILLRSCRVLVRPSKKVGYCFKIFHPREHPIYSSKGLKGETLASGIVPVSVDHCILRVNSDAERNRWIAAVELAIKQAKANMTEFDDAEHLGSNDEIDDLRADLDDDDHVSSDDDGRVVSDSETRPEPADADDHREKRRRQGEARVRPVRETRYVADLVEESDLPFDHGTEEELASESKGLLLMLIKQVRPGMDLSKVVLPTFILEPRSMLEKLRSVDHRPFSPPPRSSSHTLAIPPTTRLPYQRLVPWASIRDTPNCMIFHV
eukprot:TRINITY_DN9159_c0_g1_i2.p1 TRINITY_DN9159_c0_g1~~TRINITY_DN9159_c0_g1_i2.p1  ORF type:complete len:792 (-),score=305.87 TRINITY_DN9159_c0_g1_i2:189-2564(-)